MWARRMACARALAAASHRRRRRLHRRLHVPEADGALLIAIAITDGNQFVLTGERRSGTGFLVVGLLLVITAFYFHHFSRLLCIILALVENRGQGNMLVM